MVQYLIRISLKYEEKVESFDEQDMIVDDTLDPDEYKAKMKKMLKECEQIAIS